MSRNLNAGEIFEHFPDPEEASLNQSDSPAWPELPDEALHGLAGEFVRLVEPHTEADPAALLTQFLSAFGSVIGRETHFRVEADDHFMNIFVVLVAETSKGRKGSSWGHVRRIFESIDPDWRVRSGLSSGEGLIWQVRDPIEETKPIRAKGRFTGEYETTVSDHGESDKRLLIQEAEFGRVLTVCQRDGNTLSAITRDAWDHGDLASLAKNSPAKATGAHISIVGHITRDELLRNLDDTEAANGFANRFLFVCARRSKFLPEGGEFHKVDVSDFTRRLRSALEVARQPVRIEKDDAAREAWAAVYRDLSAGRPGLLGAVTARAEAQTMRLAALYALLEGYFVIRTEHLRAALALWKYAEESARFVFGESLGDPAADEILRSVRNAGQDGLTRTDISRLFARNKSSAQITRAINSLIERNLVRIERDDTGDGRPVEYVVWVTK